MSDEPGDAPSTDEITRITELLSGISRGDETLVDELMEKVYDRLKRIAEQHLRRERADHTLEPTALVHEAFFRLVDQKRVNWQDRTHFFAISAQMMRRILVDHAKGRSRQKRGGGRLRVAMDEALVVSPGKNEDVLAVNEALERLAKVDPLQARIVEFRFFAGMTVEEVASALNMNKRTVESEWTLVKAWLRRELTDTKNDSSEAGVH